MADSILLRKQNPKIIQVNLTPMVIQQQQSITMSASDLTITAAVSEKISWQSVVLCGSGVIFLIIILMVITRPRKRNKN